MGIARGGDRGGQRGDLRGRRVGETIAQTWGGGDDRTVRGAWGIAMVSSGTHVRFLIK